MATRRTKGISVLDADPDLAVRLAPAAREAARRHAVAPAMTVGLGDVDPASWGATADGHLSFLVLSGLLTRSVTVLGRTSIELVGAALLDRTFRRVQRTSFHVAILEHPRVDVRLMLLFWQLADRWGHVGPDGVTVPMRLTHEALGRLVRAQRPSVTVSLRHLAERDLIRRDRNGWLLCGDVSEHLDALAAGSASAPAPRRPLSELPPRLPDPG